MKSPWSRNTRRSSSTPIAIVVVLGLLVSGFLWVRLRATEGALQETRVWTQTVLDSVGHTFEDPPPVGPEGRDSLYWHWVALSARMDGRRLMTQLREARQRRGTLLSAADLARLKEAGLKDPVVQLRDSLAARPDLIPYKGYFGPRMQFATDKVVLLDAPYAFAYAENGRGGGYVLLAYDVRPGPRVRWRRLWWAELSSD